jgi:hypothetical protein
MINPAIAARQRSCPAPCAHPCRAGPAARGRRAGWGDSLGRPPRPRARTGARPLVLAGSGRPSLSCAAATGSAGLAGRAGVDVAGCTRARPVSPRSRPLGGQPKKRLMMTRVRETSLSTRATAQAIEIINKYNYLSHTLIHLLHIIIIVIGLVSNNFFP